MATLRFDPGQVGSTNNINQNPSGTNENEVEVDILKTFADVTIDGGVAYIEATVDDSELVVNDANDQTLTGANEPLPSGTPDTGETNFLEKTQGDANTTFTSLKVVMNDGTVYELKPGSAVDFREQDTSNPPGSFTPEHGDTHVESNSSIDLVNANTGADAPTGPGAFGDLNGENLIFSSAADWTTGTQTRLIDTSGNTSDSTGDGLFTVDSVICFTRGTRIKTDRGEVPVEDLEVGDRVMTMDHGLQPIRWIGSRSVPAQGKLAPVRIAAGALGNARDLLVSPQHRMLLSGWKAKLHLGEAEVLAAAAMLLNDSTIRREAGGTVEYFHMLFDSHEIVWAEGAPSESFHPGEQGWGALDRAARDEILALFPELDTSFDSYGPAARMSLKAHEARMLRQ
jgi:hypothetical protein